MDSERVAAVNRLLLEYVRNPSLRHIRLPGNVLTLAREIVTALDKGRGAWRKWEGERNDVIRAASDCWVPIEDLHAYLAEMPGPPLTRTDVEQRLRTVQDDECYGSPEEVDREMSLALYERERAAGTELLAIIGAMQELVAQERIRRSLLEQEERRRLREEKRAERLAVFLSGADSDWTPIEGRTGTFCRINGRTYRLEHNKPNKRWPLFRVRDTDDEGRLLGSYGDRSEATKALKTIAYAHEPRW